MSGGMKKKLLMILNDNKMSICPRVGGMADYLDRLRTNPVYTGLKTEVVRALNKMPVLGDPVERFLAQLKEGIKAGLHGGMLFEDLGFRYIGPIDGHNIALLRKYLQMVRKLKDPVLLHVVTEKGRGFRPAEDDPDLLPRAAGVRWIRNGQAVPKTAGGSRAYTDCVRDALLTQHAARHARDRDDRGDVPGQQAGAGSRRVSRSVLRHRHLRSRMRWRSPPAWPRAACDRSWTSTARFCSGRTTRSFRK